VIIETDHLTKRYGRHDAVRDISLTVPEGTAMALIGANGAGKTTTLRALSGLVRPRAGRIVFQGEDITALPAHKIVARGLAHVPEGRMVFTNLTVRENLAMGAYLVRDPVRVARNLDYVFGMFPRLAERIDQSAGTLSGGEQQMLAIGRALMGDPKLLMLDEPSLGLAPKLISTIFEKILEINRDHGVTILLVEQNARLALEISHEAHVLETGGIALSGPSAQLRDYPLLKAAYLGG